MEQPTNRSNKLYPTEVSSRETIRDNVGTGCKEHRRLTTLVRLYRREGRVLLNILQEHDRTFDIKIERHERYMNSTTNCSIESQFKIHTSGECNVEREVMDNSLLNGRNFSRSFVNVKLRPVPV